MFQVTRILKLVRTISKSVFVNKLACFNSTATRSDIKLNSGVVEFRIMNIILNFTNIDDDDDDDELLLWYVWPTKGV